VSLLVKMESNPEEEPDLHLKFDSNYYHYFKHQILNFTRGDYVQFNATFIFEGNHHSPPILEGFGVNRLSDHIYINPHIHSTGRYGVGHGQVNKDNALFQELPNVVLDESVKLEQHETNH